MKYNNGFNYGIKGPEWSYNKGKCPTYKQGKMVEVRGDATEPTKPKTMDTSEGGGESKIDKFMKKKPKSTLLADNTQGLITTKQTKPRPVASATPHPITPAYVKRRKFRWRICKIGKFMQHSRIC